MPYKHGIKEIQVVIEGKVTKFESKAEGYQKAWGLLQEQGHPGIDTLIEVLETKSGKNVYVVHSLDKEGCLTLGFDNENILPIIQAGSEK